MLTDTEIYQHRLDAIDERYLREQITDEDAKWDEKFNVYQQWSSDIRVSTIETEVKIKELQIKFEYWEKDWRNLAESLRKLNEYFDHWIDELHNHNDSGIGDTLSINERPVNLQPLFERRSTLMRQSEEMNRNFNQFTEELNELHQRKSAQSLHIQELQVKFHQFVADTRPDVIESTTDCHTV